MWDPRIEVNGQSVLAHGSLVTYGNEPITIYPLPEPNTGYEIKLIFQQIEGQPASINAATITPGHFQIALTNFDVPGGTGTSIPLYVAQIDKRKVLLNLSVYYVGPPQTGTRTVHYTFFQGGPS